MKKLISFLIITALILSFTTISLAEKGDNIISKPAVKAQNNGVVDFKKATHFLDKGDLYSALYYTGLAYEKGYKNEIVEKFIFDNAHIFWRVAYNTYHEGNHNMSYNYYKLLTELPCVPDYIVEDSLKNTAWITPSSKTLRKSN